MGFSKRTITKVVELVLALTCLGLHFGSWYEVEEITKVLIAGTFVGYSIITLVTLAGHLMDTPLHTRVEVLYCLIGCGLFVGSGFLIIEDWQEAVFRDKTIGMAKGVLAIVNGIIFFADSVVINL